MTLHGRIWVTPRELAKRLEVHESQVSRDERNECFGVLKGKIQLLIANAGPSPYAELREQLLNS